MNKRQDSAALDQGGSSDEPARKQTKKRTPRAKTVKRTTEKPTADEKKTRRPTAASAGRSRSGRARREELNHTVILELRALRTKINRASEAFDLRLAGQVSELLQILEGDPSLSQKPKPLTVKAAQATLDALGSLRVKPKRGQIKDLRRLERAVRKLSDVASAG